MSLFSPTSTSPPGRSNSSRQTQRFEEDDVAEVVGGRRRSSSSGCGTDLLSDLLLGLSPPITTSSSAPSAIPPANKTFLCGEYRYPDSPLNKILTKSRTSAGRSASTTLLLGMPSEAFAGLGASDPATAGIGSSSSSSLSFSEAMETATSAAFGVAGCTPACNRLLPCKRSSASGDGRGPDDLTLPGVVDDVGGPNLDEVFLMGRRSSSSCGGSGGARNEEISCARSTPSPPCGNLLALTMASSGSTDIGHGLMSTPGDRCRASKDPDLTEGVTPALNKGTGSIGTSVSSSSGGAAPTNSISPTRSSSPGSDTGYGTSFGSNDNNHTLESGADGTENRAAGGATSSDLGRIRDDAMGANCRSTGPGQNVDMDGLSELLRNLSLQHCLRSSAEPGSMSSLGNVGIHHHLRNGSSYGGNGGLVGGDHRGYFTSGNVSSPYPDDNLNVLSPSVVGCGQTMYDGGGDHHHPGSCGGSGNLGLVSGSDVTNFDPEGGWFAGHHHHHHGGVEGIGNASASSQHHHYHSNLNTFRHQQQHHHHHQHQHNQHQHHHFQLPSVTDLDPEVAQVVAVRQQQQQQRLHLKRAEMLQDFRQLVANVANHRPATSGRGCSSLTSAASKSPNVHSFGSRAPRVLADADTVDVLTFPAVSNSFYRNSMVGGGTSDVASASSAATSAGDAVSLERAARIHRNSAASNDATCTWSGHLPLRNQKSAALSCKVFLGGVPWDITEVALAAAFKPFGSVRIEWPGKENSSIPRGYLYIIFEHEKQVKALLSACTHDFGSGGSWYYKVSSKRMRNKEVQVIPWIIADSSFVRCQSQRLDPQKTVFVGALHGMLNAEGLCNIFDDLFGGVVYAGIDTDKYKYPIGSARVTFNNHKSYMKAVAAAFIEIKTSRFTKKVQVDPYLEDALCTSCGIRQGPYFCRDMSCFKYFCRYCWEVRHQFATYHKPLMRNCKSAKDNAGGCFASSGGVPFSKTPSSCFLSSMLSD